MMKYPERHDGRLPSYRAVMLDMRAASNALEVRTFYSLAIQPICQRLADDLAHVPPCSDNEARNLWESLRTVQLETHRSFALSLGAMWERSIRENLRNAAFILASPVSPKLMNNVNRGGWKGIVQAFKSIRGFDLDWFPMYTDLEILFDLSSAIRHGDGDAADKVQRIGPSFFLDYVVETGWYSHFAHGGDPNAAVRKLHVPLEALEKFTEAVAGFWDLIDRLRQSTFAQA